MPKQDTFSVAKKGVEPVEVTFNAPENLADPRWDELLSNRDEDIHTLALQNLIIKIQGGARSRLEDGEAAVQEYVDQYKFGSRAAGAPRTRKATIPAERARELGFTEEQLAALRAAGVQIPGMEEESDEE